MSTRANTPADICILGGGIAGLWLAVHLAKTGRGVVLIERAALGDGQTIASQGIIHGGVKYALTGAASAASRAIARMPELWRNALAGDGPVDLRGVQVLSDRQWMWSTASLLSRMTALAGSKVIRTPVQLVRERAEVCPGLQPAPKGVDIYEVPEPVLEPRSLVASLARQAEALGVRLILGQARLEGQDVLAGSVRLSPAVVLLCAGGGNAGLLEQSAAAPMPRAQSRPLHMVLVRGPLPVVYGHCVAGLSDKPRVTIGTQDDPAMPGRRVWYIGGQIAEAGVHRDAQAQIAEAKRELAACIPWVTLDGLEWGTCRWERFEGLTASGDRPDEPVIVELTPGGGASNPGPRLLAIWPTKLAFAPLVGERVSAMLTADQPLADLNPGVGTPWRHATIAPLPWDRPEVLWSP